MHYDAIRAGRVPDDRVSKDDMNMGVIAHGLSFVEGGLIGPLVLYFIKRTDSPFVAFHALQSLLWGVLFLVLGIGAVVSFFVVSIVASQAEALAGLFALALLLAAGGGGLLYFVLEIVACLKASKRLWWRLPIVGSIAQGFHPVPPLEDAPTDDL